MEDPQVNAAGRGGETAVRDELARLRTVLANERTLLSFIRTALAFGAGGVAVVQLYPTRTGVIVGWSLVCLGALVLLVGIARFRTMHRLLAVERDADRPNPLEERRP